MRSLWFCLLSASPLLRGITSTSSPPRAFQLKLSDHAPKLRWKTSNPPHSYRATSLLLSSLLPCLPLPPCFSLGSPPFSGDRGILFDARNGCWVKSCRGSRWQSWWNLRASVYMFICVCVCVCLQMRNRRGPMSALRQGCNQAHHRTCAWAVPCSPQEATA